MPANHAAAVSFAASEASFAAHLSAELASAPGAELYPDVFADAHEVILTWRRRYAATPQLWRRLYRADRVLKELIEAAPVIAAVRDVVAEASLALDEQFTIVDLCSGKGFLSMFLSDMLGPTGRVERCLLIDKAWPPHEWEGPIGERHISDAHIYSERLPLGAEAGAEPPVSYFETWPVPLHTSKRDLKNRATVRKLDAQLWSRCSGPVLLLGVHLCGTLALRAVDIFNASPSRCRLLVLKPCCLPPMLHAKRHETFRIGHHAFPASDVCASGSFKARRGGWEGPPRADLRPRFERWTEHLCAGVELGGVQPGESGGGDDRSGGSSSSCDGGAKAVHFSQVQIRGGYQNQFVVAERGRLTRRLWERVQEDERRDREHQARESSGPDPQAGISGAPCGQK